MSFALKKIPVLFLHTGQHADYHRPTDDADKVNYDGIEKVVDFARRVTEKLLTQPREQYVAADDAHSGFGPASGSGSGGGFRASLGVVPDYGAEGVKGVRISGTSPGSPAEKAGLKEGDVIVQWGETKLASVYDLTEQLTKAKPGTVVKLGVERGGERVELEATLGAPRR
jgi:S1-C subfamily serine protease